MSKKINTSWGKEADWYGEVVNQSDSFQNKVILPNILRLLNIKKGEQILELGSGTGFFSKAFAKEGAKVTGVELGEELVKKAREISSEVKYHVASADNLKFIDNSSFDKVVIILALQNMENLAGVINECARVLNPNGKLYLVLNHPAFRIPQASEWGWDDNKKVQYRRIDRYLSEMKIKIAMHPGSDKSAVTWSFHRSLQAYFKVLTKNGLAVTRLEEWNSHTKTPYGPRAEAENRARAEFPMFLCLEALKLAK